MVILFDYLNLLSIILGWTFVQIPDMILKIFKRIRKVVPADVVTTTYEESRKMEHSAISISSFRGGQGSANGRKWDIEAGVTH